MHNCARFLLLVTNLTSYSDSATTISYKSDEILAIRECLESFLAKFSLRMRCISTSVDKSDIRFGVVDPDLL